MPPDVPLYGVNMTGPPMKTGEACAKAILTAAEPFIAELSHQDRVAWFGGFLGYAMGNAGGFVGPEALHVVGEILQQHAGRRLKGSSN